MRNLVWGVTALLLLLWSGLAWLAHGLVGVGGEFVATNADILPADPLLVEWASWLASAGTGVGEWLIVALWALVSLVIVALGFVAARLVPRFTSAAR